MSNYKHILCPIDFSDVSERTIEKAKQLAKLFGAKVTLLTIVEPLPAIAYGYAGGTDIQEEMLKSCHTKIQEWGSKHGIDKANCQVETGYPKHEITVAAKQLKADLIIMGSHGHHGVVSTLLGSTSNAVANHSEIDVMIVRS